MLMHVFFSRPLRGLARAPAVERVEAPFWMIRVFRVKTDEEDAP
jgi:hypothetical protein